MDMTVTKKSKNKGKEKALTMWQPDWTSLPEDIMIQVFPCLGIRDRASLSSTCKPWWRISKSPNLWRVLDLRLYQCDAQVAKSLASRCTNLQKIQIRGLKTAESMMNLEANSLREISIECYWDITNSTIITLVAQHKLLECIQIVPNSLKKVITSDAIIAIALSCPNLKKLWLFSVKVVSGEAINALALNCQNLTDIGFIDCGKVDEVALGNVRTLVFLSVAGTKHINWNLAGLHWSNLLNLVCLDVSRTKIKPRVVSLLFQSCLSLEVMCALNYPVYERNLSSINRRGKILVAYFTNILKELTTLFIDMPKENGNVFLDWRNSNNLKDRKLEGVLDWLERTICNFLMNFLELYFPSSPDKFWLEQGTVLLRSFLESPHEDVQETAAKALAAFDVSEDVSMNIGVKVIEGVVPKDVIRYLVNLARSSQEGLQEEAIHALTNMSSNPDTAKVVVDEGGVDTLVNIAGSARKTLLGKALFGLKILSRYQSAFANKGKIRALIDIIVKSTKSEDSKWVMKNAIATLANLASDETCSREIESVGGVHALVRILEIGIAKDVKEKSVIEMTVKALWNMSCNAKNSMRIIDEDGVPKLAHLCSSSLSKLVVFMSALALANMFDARLDELAMIGTSESTSNCARLEGARRMASEAIQAFLKSFSADASSSSLHSEAMTSVIELPHVQKPDMLRCSGSQMERLLSMLRHSSPFVVSCGAFALFQLTLPGARYMLHNVKLLAEARAQQMLLQTEASESAPPEAKVFARFVLKHLEHYHVKCRC